jgi:hypothetical protein
VGLEDSDRIASVASLAVSTITGIAGLMAAYRSQRHIAVSRPTIMPDVL